ncbi:MAG TPA: sugar phosphate isomerase/epimerase [Candidatus Methylomirabilis sp.]|nr:sugar phosphate isomerase/epimerase [Candidatus Methylomirabilis sp.]HSB82684.1 sugar phosphate isomerase/epimerase [Candidatus Methylomirabilis sp.]HSC71248.1 sugar phosphate isomerase/epimerase [Candidatus Methylomirabilis sp.]
MLLDRRSFLRAALTGPLLAQDTLVMAQQGIRPIGLQLYTLRTVLPKDFNGTLARVAAIGYKEVEFVGYFGRSPGDVRAALQSNGLTGVSAHVNFGALGDQWPGVVDDARTIGHQYLVVGSVDEAPGGQPDIWRRAAEQLNRAGAVCKAAGITLAYHNHMVEFAIPVGTTKRPYEILVESTEPSLVSLQIDLCWITAAGQNPITYLTRYPGRVVSVHVKDLKRLPSPPSRKGDVPDIAAVLPDLADVGQGVIDWKTVLSQCWSAGIRHYFVEHDQPGDPLASIGRSYKYLSAMRLDVAR